MVEEIYNCCQAIGVRTGNSPVDGTYLVTDTDDFGQLKYKHIEQEWTIYQVRNLVSKLF